MPIYEYYCADCGLDFEVMRSVSQSGEPSNCEKCGNPAKRQLSNFAFKSNTFTAPKLKPATKPRRSYNVGESTESPSNLT